MTNCRGGCRLDLKRDHWKTVWEDNADNERKTYNSMEVGEVLRMVKEGHYGDYYSIWYSISERATLEQAGYVLLEVLHRDIRYLLRANCAGALIRLMNEKQIRGVDLSADRPDQNEFLEKIEKKLGELIENKKGRLHG